MTLVRNLPLLPIEPAIVEILRRAVQDGERGLGTLRLSADEGLSIDVSSYTLYAPSATPEQPAEWLIRCRTFTSAFPLAANSGQ